MWHKRRTIRLDTIYIMNEKPVLGQPEISSKFQRWRYARNLAKVRYQNEREGFHRYDGLPDPGPLHRENHNEDRDFLRPLLNELLSLRNGYTHNLWLHRSLRLFILIVSAAVPVMAVLQISRWTLAAVSALVVVAEGVTQLFRFQERALLQMRLFGQMRRETDAYLTRSSIYKNNENAFQDFVESITAIKVKIDDGMIEELSRSSNNPPPTSPNKQN